MNCLAPWFYVSFGKAVLKVCEGFVECINSKPVYFIKINCDYVTLETSLPWDFQKYINNNGSIYLKDFEINEKTLTFVHYTYEISNNRLIMANIQGVGHQLYDFEIATQMIMEEKSNRSKLLVECLFSVGNLSTTAFENFEREHVCNTYSIKLELAQL